ncbi:hypothetical protein RhiirB3_392486 [Rhizophagus irregularis]|nr:hypothetical protein RhiirB3_392486 [Rhizophagus irregularis]
MAGYAPKKFRRVSGEDPELWLQEFRQWCESAGLDPAANARTRVRIHGIFETLLEDDARDWYETHIKGKNWECRLVALGYKLGLLRDIDISKISIEDLEAFIDTELNKNLPPNHAYHGNQVFGISSGTRRSKSKKCSSCGKSGHTKSSCPKSKKKKKTNYTHDSFDSADSSDSTDSDSDSDSYSASRHTCYGLKKRVQKDSMRIRKKELMIGIVSSNMAVNLIRKNEDSMCTDSFWFFNRKSASDVVTIKTKRLNLDVDRSNASDLSGVVTKSDTIGTVYGLGILVYDGENSKKIENDFMVVKSDKDFLLLGVPWIDRANVILDFQNRQLTIPLSLHKKITIPISLHKRKTNVTGYY